MYKITLLICLFSISAFAQSINPINWEFATDDKINSHTITDEHLVFFGCDDQYFYALEQQNGKIKWKYLSNNIIRSRAVVNNEILFFSNGISLYALNKNSGNELWKFESKSDSVIASPTDFWDFHQGSPALL